MIKIEGKEKIPSKRRIWGRIAVVLVLIIAGFSYCRFGGERVKTLAVEGVVRDARTKEPISEVVINCSWVGSDPKVMDTSFTGYRGKSVVTDKSGRYAMPAVDMQLWKFQRFIEMAFSAYHPLYVREMWNWPWKRMGAGSDRPDYWSIMSEHAQNGVIHYDIELTHIRDRFKGPEDRIDFSNFLSAVRPHYWKTLEDTYGIEIAPLEILREYEAIKKTINPTGDFKDLGRIRDEINKMMEEGY